MDPRGLGDKRLVEQAKADRRLYEIATLAALRERLRSADIWVEGSRAFRPINENFMPRPTFTKLKETDQLGLGVQRDGVAWLTEMQQLLDFNLKRLAHRAQGHAAAQAPCCSGAGAVNVTYLVRISTE